MVKVIQWVMVNGASILGVTQAVVKAVKELVTAIVNVISIFMSKEQAEDSVKTVRGLINKLDDVLENIKTWLVK